MMPTVRAASSSLGPVPGPLMLATGMLLALASPDALAIAPASVPGEVVAPTAGASPSGAPPAAAPPATAPPASAPSDLLRVKVATAIDDGSLIPGWVAERNARIGEQVLTREGHEQWLEVEISGDTYDYRVLVKAMRDGAAVEPVAAVATCECNNEKLLELVDERIALAVEQLQRSADQELSSKGPPAPDRTTPPPVSLAPERERRTISVFGIGGIATAGFGAGALAGGIVMVLIKPQPVRDRYSLARNYEVPGIAALAVGGTALAAGVTMLVVDVIQCRKLNAPPRCYRKEAKEPRFEVGPSLEANGGITVIGRF